MSIFISSEKICQIICLSTRPGQLLFAYHSEIKRKFCTNPSWAAAGPFGPVIAQDCQWVILSQGETRRVPLCFILSEDGGAAGASFFQYFDFIE
ncbi:MAG: hypothetical protein ACYDBT_17640 [Desulfobulbaceae bacterium]